jgi:hypothetical protein
MIIPGFYKDTQGYHLIIGLKQSPKKHKEPKYHLLSLMIHKQNRYIADVQWPAMSLSRLESDFNKQFDECPEEEFIQIMNRKYYWLIKKLFEENDEYKRYDIVKSGIAFLKIIKLLKTKDYAGYIQNYKIQK